MRSSIENGAITHYILYYMEILYNFSQSDNELLAINLFIYVVYHVDTVMHPSIIVLPIYM